MSYPTQLFPGTSRGGRLNIDDRGAFDKYMESIGDAVVEVTVRVTRPINMATAKQIKAYWGGIVKPIAKKIGHTSPEIHEVLKKMYLAPEEGDIKPSIKRLSKDEMSDYMEQCIALGVEYGAEIEFGGFDWKGIEVTEH